MLVFIRNSSLKSTVYSSIARRLSSISTQTENDETKVKQEKYQELEKLQYRPLYLDAQATTPMVNKQKSNIL